MTSLFKKLKEWHKQRIERNYERIISTYSPEEQELIKKGRNVTLTSDSIDKLIEENPDKEIIPLTGRGSLYKFFGKPVNPVKHELILFNQTSLGIRAYETDVGYWLEIGELGADILCDFNRSVAGLSDGASLTLVSSGIPVKIQDKNKIDGERL